MTSFVSAGLGGFIQSSVHRALALTCHSERSVPMYLFPEIVPYDFRSGRVVEESLLAFLSSRGPAAKDPQGALALKNVGPRDLLFDFSHSTFAISTPRANRSPSSPLAAESPKLPASSARCPVAR